MSASGRPLSSCPSCGEWRIDALRYGGMCANCSTPERTIGYGVCTICRRDAVPLQKHHIAGKQHHSVCLVICRSCHAVVTHRQREYQSSLEAILYGVVDLIVVYCQYHHIDAIFEMASERIVELWERLRTLLSTYVPTPNLPM